jgi:hypothetical protein
MCVALLWIWTGCGLRGSDGTRSVNRSRCVRPPVARSLCLMSLGLMVFPVQVEMSVRWIISQEQASVVESSFVSSRSTRILRADHTGNTSF